MEEEEKNIELIEAFQKGELTGKELTDFERRRADDLEFANEVADYLLIMNEIRSSQERIFGETLKKWELEIDRDSAEKKVVPFRKILSIAATLLIIAVAAGYAIFQFYSVPDSEELFTMYFAPHDDVISQRSDGQGFLQQGMNLYNQKNYTGAITYFEKYLREKPGEASVECYLGIAYLADGKTDEAKDLFDGVVRRDQGLYKEIAQWNLSLIHLKLNKKELLKKSLADIIAQKDHFYQKEAVSLYKDLQF
jgi:tetratricopeptide (TPR) repeat protein